MTQNDFKKLLDEALETVKNDLKDVKETQKEFQKKLDEVENTIETRILPPLVEIETTVKSYADRYVTNQDHIGRLDKRLKTVEDNLGIHPPQDLSIPTFE